MIEQVTLQEGIIRFIVVLLVLVVVSVIIMIVQHRKEQKKRREEQKNHLKHSTRPKTPSESYKVSNDEIVVDVAAIFTSDKSYDRDDEGRLKVFGYALIKHSLESESYSFKSVDAFVGGYNEGVLYFLAEIINTYKTNVDTVNIEIDNPQLIFNITNHLKKWAKNDFKNSRGKDIKNIDAWKALYDMLKESNAQVSFSTPLMQVPILEVKLNNLMSRYTNFVKAAIYSRFIDSTLDKFM